ncbi:cysteine hydrolase family protein [Sinisalibacter aestuarii]|uniref:Peroxyureidoacrylate/ureidoacrylate amidohydrolase RutB n=1 Tax=Sinisalibacter aestuarii TaxID=2949426 RepID=A0ABQ5LY79_9RHOB|nr:isochorismatase family cysteine hydrolase [Sinisalibacter aestuarii]GKY89924.1 peroxyureidoacrylate/ureidoacrylate amidohydrolase RutB [Sinisalibacter aestuarii]
MAGLTTLAAQVAPAHTALLVIDIQNDFCDEAGFLSRERGYDVSFAAPVVDRIGALVADARAAGAGIVWLRSHYDFRFLSEAQQVKRGAEGCCLEGAWGADFYRIAPEPGDTVVTKHSFSGFWNTGLDALLKEMGVKTLVVTGVATNVCVDSTLRDGFFAGYYIVLAEDCVGSNNAAGHAGTVATVRTNFGMVADSVQIIAAMRGQGG